jgi:hypothetical protein
VSSLRPHVTVPHEARGAFAAALPALVGVWALAEFYLSLGPSPALQLLHSKNLLWGGVVIFMLTGLGAAASAAVARKSPAGLMLGWLRHSDRRRLGDVRPIETDTPAVLFVGTAVPGLGFGSAFVGLPRHSRAGRFRRPDGAHHRDLHRQLSRNWHSGRDRRHRNITLRVAQDRACLLRGRRSAGCGRGQPPDPSNG